MTLPKLKQFQNVEEVEKNQKKVLRNLMKHVWDKSRFYRTFYEDHGLKRENIPELTVRDLPPVEKKMIMDNWDDVVTIDNPKLKKSYLSKYLADSSNLNDLFLDDEFLVIHSSGTTGDRAFFIYSKDEFMYAASHLMGRFPIVLPTNQNKTTKIAFVGAIDGRYMGATMTRFMTLVGCDVLLADVNDPLAVNLRKLEEFQPKFLRGYPNSISVFADQQIKGNLHISPVSIACGGAVLTPHCRERIRLAWDAEVADSYICSETLGMSSICTYGSLHLFEDINIFEVLDEESNVVKRGDEGRLYLTNLYCMLVPLIRYKTGDKLTLSEVECECGTPFNVVKNIAGRIEEFCWFKDRKGESHYIHPATMSNFLVKGLHKLQFVQRTQEEFTLRVVIDNQKVVSQIVSQMRDILTQHGLIHSVSFDVEVVEDIPVDRNSGKYKRMLPIKL